MQEEALEVGVEQDAVGNHLVYPGQRKTVITQMCKKRRLKLAWNRMQSAIISILDRKKKSDIELSVVFHVSSFISVCPFEVGMGQGAVRNHLVYPGAGQKNDIELSVCFPHSVFYICLSV